MAEEAEAVSVSSVLHLEQTHPQGHRVRCGGGAGGAPCLVLPILPGPSEGLVVPSAAVSCTVGVIGAAGVRGCEGRGSLWCSETRAINHRAEGCQALPG